MGGTASHWPGCRLSSMFFCLFLVRVFVSLLLSPFVPCPPSLPPLLSLFFLYCVFFCRFFVVFCFFLLFRSFYFCPHSFLYYVEGMTSIEPLPCAGVSKMNFYAQALVLGGCGRRARWGVLYRRGVMDRGNHGGLPRRRMGGAEEGIAESEKSERGMTGGGREWVHSRKWGRRL